MIVLIFQERKQRLASRYYTLGCEHENKASKNKAKGLLDGGEEGQTKIIFIYIFPP